MRTDRGFSLGDLADRANVTTSFLSLLEADKRRASTPVLNRIAKALEVPEEVLIWDAVEVPSSLTVQDRRLCEMAKTIVRKFYVALDSTIDKD